MVDDSPIPRPVVDDHGRNSKTERGRETIKEDLIRKKNRVWNEPDAESPIYDEEGRRPKSKVLLAASRAVSSPDTQGVEKHTAYEVIGYGAALVHEDRNLNASLDTARLWRPGIVKHASQILSVSKQNKVKVLLDEQETLLAFL